MRNLLVLLCLFALSCAPKATDKVAENTVPSDKIEVSGTLKVHHLCDSAWIHRYDQKYIATLIERAQSEEKQCDVMFFGSSSIRLWKSLQQDMAPLKVVNRGYGGATLRDLHYNYPIVMADYQPKAFVLYCDNDLRTNPKTNITVGELFDLYRMLFDRLEADYPGVPVYFLAIKHCKRREAIRDRQAHFNAIMKEYCDISEQVTFVDTCSELLTDKGDIDTTLFTDDNIHLNEAGYVRWTKLIKPILMKYFNL